MKTHATVLAFWVSNRACHNQQLANVYSILQHMKHTSYYTYQSKAPLFSLCKAPVSTFGVGFIFDTNSAPWINTT